MPVGIGAFFILFIAVVTVLFLGTLVYIPAARLRRAKLDPEEDRLDGEPQETSRPEHVHVSNEQHSDLLPGR
jgi:hypothetical protein